MTHLRRYRFELCWLIVILALYALTPVRTSADSWTWEEMMGDCPETSGWCLDILEIDR